MLIEPRGDRLALVDPATGDALAYGRLRTELAPEFVAMVRNLSVQFEVEEVVGAGKPAGEEHAQVDKSTAKTKAA